jgi:hypothetical protein
MPTPLETRSQEEYLKQQNAPAEVRLADNWQTLEDTVNDPRLRILLEKAWQMKAFSLTQEANYRSYEPTVKTQLRPDHRQALTTGKPHSYNVIYEAQPYPTAKFPYGHIDLEIPVNATNSIQVRCTIRAQEIKPTRQEYGHKAGLNIVIQSNPLYSSENFTFYSVGDVLKFFNNPDAFEAIISPRVEAH